MSSNENKAEADEERKNKRKIIYIWYDMQEIDSRYMVFDISIDIALFSWEPEWANQFYAK